VRKILLEGEDLAPEAELFLFLADRAQHVRQLIKPTLERGMTVLCDRFADSTIVYQGAARAIDPQFVKKACDLAVQGLSPDITFLLDIDPELGLKRTVNRKQDRIEREKLEFHHTIRAAYLQLAKENPERIIVLDASRSPEEIKQEALHALGW
jgi:dTMP kinase